MSRTNKTQEYVLLINAKSGGDIRRFCEIRVDSSDNVYVFQPHKGGSVKVSYHESGQKHLKIGHGTAMFVMHLDSPEWIRSEEPVWAKSFENFAELPYYDDQRGDALFEFRLPPVSEDSLSFLQVTIGRVFDSGGWTMDEVRQTIVREKVFEVPQSPSQLRLCVRLLKLSRPTSG